jgi:hypothetical protein
LLLRNSHDPRQRSTANRARAACHGGCDRVCRFGVYLGDDAMTYVDAARELLAHRGFVMNNEVAALPQPVVPIVNWPPGYPYLIVALASLGVDPPRASWRIGLLSYMALVVVCVRLAARRLGIATAWTTGVLLN